MRRRVSMKGRLSHPAALGVAFACGFLAHALMPREPAHAQGNGKVFELRTYTAADGKLEPLHSRFREHTLKLFQKHGMTNLYYWKPTDAPLSGNTLVYVLAHSSREAAKKSWDAFRADPDWIRVKTESEAKGPLTAKVESLFLEIADYSPMK
jgi:hypothetical protein